ncbi:hypothetical protein QMZ05_00910 [Bradyrhizobium sp. INPA03-11B]|uniref:hypothetical protein n=1 Tax=Bradyrhizobium sp. INPA03-11B TaxID=418598 RepID=UPI00338ED525
MSMLSQTDAASRIFRPAHRSHMICFMCDPRRSDADRSGPVHKARSQAHRFARRSAAKISQMSAAQMIHCDIADGGSRSRASAIRIENKRPPAA